MKKIIAVLTVIWVVGFLCPAVYAQPGDADNGEKLYGQQCIYCHRDGGQGGIGPPLVGCSVCDSLESLFDKIDSDMPKLYPPLCTDTCAWDTAAYIFEVLNGDTTPIPEELCPAEAIYGVSSDKTELLRNYRDTILANTSWGQNVIRIYYKWGPAMFHVVKENTKVKETLIRLLDTMLPFIASQLELNKS